MADNARNVQQFLDAMSSYARKNSDAIHREVEEYKASRLREEEKKVLTESAALAKREHDTLQKEIRRELTRRETEARQELLSFRKTLVEQVFDRTRQALDAFVRSADYGAFLCRSLRRLTAVLPAEGTVYTLSRRDEALLPLLQPLCPQGSRLQPDDSVTLGGLKGYNEEAGIAADDTLDSRLTRQIPWFAEHSGLTVE